MYAIVLAKKKSQRLGCNKALIKIDGEPIIARVIKAVKSAGYTPLIVTDDDRLREWGDVVQDSLMKGPLGGLYIGLLSAESEFNLLVGSDMPYLDAQFLKELRRRVGGYGVVVPKAEGFLQPLCSLYSKRLIPLIKEQIEKNRLSLCEMIEKTDALYIHTDSKDSFFSINRKEDIL
jgi:molybdopterin-guanine dinucleotide biosynthesis protein A